MRLLVVTNMWPSEHEPSAGIFVKEQVDDLRAAGLEATVVAFDGREDAREYGRAVRRVRDALRTVRPDVVHAHYGLTGAVCILARARPLVTTFHGSDTGYKPWQLRVSRRVARRCTTVVVDPSAAGRLRPREAPAVLPMGVDTGLFAPPASRDAVRARLGWDPLGTYVVFPGSRTARVKNHPLFEQALAALRRDVPGVTGVPLEGLTRPQVADVLGAADLTLMTSHFEGSPVTVRESLACGTPVVSVPVGDVAHQLAGLPGCAVADADPELLAAAAAAALARSPGRAELAAAVRGRTDRATIADRLLALYGEVAGRRAG